jgi:hypothetical protein
MTSAREHALAVRATGAGALAQDPRAGFVRGQERLEVQLGERDVDGGRERGQGRHEP